MKTINSNKKRKNHSNVRQYSIVLLVIMCVFSSCDDNKIQNNSTLIDTLSVRKETQSTTALDLYFQNLLDFNEYKSVNKEMLNCGKASPNLLKPNSIGFYYNYCVFNAMLGTKKVRGYNDDEKLIVFHTWKKSLKGKEGLYNSNNEILLGIQCAVEDERLKQSNWVEKDSLFILKRLGQPQNKSFKQFYYYKDNKFLILNFVKNKVSWYKYFSLEKAVQNDFFTNKKIVEWSSTSR